MTTLNELRQQFQAGRLAKAAYIDQMNQRHRLLHEYGSLLAGTDIASIEITEGRVLMTTREGLKLICSKDDKRLAPLEMLNFGALEKPEAEMSLRLAPDGGTFLDIGANIGWYSLLLTQKLKRSRCLAFEPIPSTFKALKAHLALNQASRVTAFNLGFSDKAGKIDIYF